MDKLNLRRMSDREVYNTAVDDKEFVDFMDRHESGWEDKLFMGDISLAYKIWYHAKTYKPDPNGVNSKRKIDD
jgi:hypothetical protein